MPKVKIDDGMSFQYSKFSQFQLYEWSHMAEASTKVVGFFILLLSNLEYFNRKIRRYICVFHDIFLR